MSKGRLLFYLGILVCAVFWFTAINAWLTHRDWLETGAYERNSLPMNRVARDLTLAASLATALLIGITGWQLTRRAAKRTQQG